MFWQEAKVNKAQDVGINFMISSHLEPVTSSQDITLWLQAKKQQIPAVAYSIASVRRMLTSDKQVFRAIYTCI